MDMMDDKATSDFIDMLAGDVRARFSPVSPANIIKARRVTVNGKRQVEVPAVGDDEPRVILHRDGEDIQRVEFVCTCGKTASLQIHYEGE
jgi:hypothetical protein